MSENENFENVNENVEIDIIDEPVIDYKDKYIRLLAEFENYKRRTSEQEIINKQRIQFKANKNLIDVYNDAFLSTKNNISDESKEGILMFMSKIEGILNNGGIHKMVITDYDVDVHEVVACLIPGSTNIIDIARNGWISGEVILEYPQVVLG